MQWQLARTRGVITTYGYDTLNRISQVSYNTVSGVTTAPAVTYIYDTDPTYGTAKDGSIVRMNVGTDYQERYTFDQYKRTSGTIRRMGSQTYTTTDSYNQASQPLQNTFGTFGYDNAGRVSSIAAAGNVGMSGMTYNIAGQVTGDTLTSSGVYKGHVINSSTAETFGYDTNRMQLISQTAVTTNTNGSFCVPPPCPPPPPGGTNLSLNYSYQASAGQMGVGTTAGNAGQLMAINNNSSIGGVAESASYSYDNYGRLVTSNQTSNGSSAQRRFAYDRWGNRSGVWDATSGGNQIQNVSLQAVSFPGTGSAPTNRITSVGNGKSGLTYSSYDANGNVTNDGAHSYTYDSENRLVNVDNGAAVYAYDHQNRRYKKSIGSSVTHYVWEGYQVISEYNGSTGAMLVQYGYAGSRMISKSAGSTTQYFLSDRLSIRVALSNLGVVAGRQATLPFGEDFAESGTQEKHHFTSYERDIDNGLDYAVNRNHSSNLGRFQQADPYKASGYMVDPQSWNRYAYVRNNPVNRVDRVGLDDGDPNPFICSNCEISIGPAPSGIIAGGGDEMLREEPIILDPGIGQNQGPPPGLGEVPVPNIPPPPPPQITNLADLLKYWDGIRDWINSKGSCGPKLARYMGQLNNLVQSSVLHLRDTVANPALLAKVTPWGTTVGGEFNAGNDAVTIFSAKRGGRGALIRVDIYLGSSFYASNSEWQAMTFMHELLHAVLRGNDSAIETGLGTGGLGVTQWIDRGCP